MSPLTDLQARIMFVLKQNGAPMTADAIARELRTSAHGIKLSLSSPACYAIRPVRDPAPTGKTLYQIADRKYWESR